MVAPVSIGDGDTTSRSATDDQRTERTVVTEAEATGAADHLPKDVVFGLLSNERRRHVLGCLQQSTETMRVGDLANTITSIETDKPVAAISSKERKRVYVGLYQSHLPMMNDANVIDYDRSRGTVALRPNADQLYAYLAIDPFESDRRESWLETRVSSLNELKAKLSPK